MTIMITLIITKILKLQLQRVLILRNLGKNKKKTKLFGRYNIFFIIFIIIKEKKSCKTVIRLSIKNQNLIHNLKIQMQIMQIKIQVEKIYLKEIQKMRKMIRNMMKINLNSL